MKNRFKTFYLILILIAGLVSACSSPPAENAAPGNSNTAQPAIPENGTPSATSGTSPQPSNVVSATGEVTTTRVEAQPVPAVGPQAAVPVTPDAQQVRVAGLPKIVVPVKKINFGKQPQDKLLTRTFVVRNSGKSELKIEAVEPS